MMNYPLAIVLPTIGICSETFIRRHIEDLLPGRTVAVANNIDGGAHGGHWEVDCPVLVLNSVEDGGLKGQIIRAMRRRVGLCLTDHLDLAERFLKRHRVEVILGEYLNFSLQWMELAKRLGKRFFAHAHGYDISERLRDPKWQAEYTRYREASGVITMSHVSCGRLLAQGLDPAKLHVVPYGVDVPNEPLRRADQEVVRCVAVGRMVAKKAPILTLDAFRRATEACPRLRLDYVGTGALFPAVQQFVRAFDLEEQVKLHGGQPNGVVQSLMRDADVFLQHSMTDPMTGDEEGLPVAILEAMANSLPVVSTRHAGIPEAVVDGLTGYLVEEGDKVAMAERLMTLALNPDLRRTMGEAGWRRAKEHFSWERERSQLLDILGLKYAGS